MSSDEDLLRMAKESGLTDPDLGDWMTDYGRSEDSIKKFAELVAAAAAVKEREACASLAQATVCDTHIPTGINIYGTRVAAAIRARSAQ